MYAFTLLVYDVCADRMLEKNIYADKILEYVYTD